MCAYYAARPEQGLMQVIQTPPPKCIVRVGDPNPSVGYGYIEGYYEGGKFCMKSYGAYFNNSGIRDSTECTPVSGASGVSGARSGEPGGNPFADILRDPNLKWYAAVAVVIATLSLLSRRLLSRRQGKRP